MAFVAGQVSAGSIKTPDPIKKYRFIAHTGNKTIVLAMGNEITQGENRWTEAALRNFMRPDLEEAFSIEFLDPDPRIQQEEVLDTTKKDSNTTKVKEIPVTPTNLVENKNGQIEEKLEIETDEGSSGSELLKANKNREALNSFTATRFSRLDLPRAKKQVDKITDLKKLNKVLVELEGYQNTQAHRKLIAARIGELEATS